VGHCCGWAYRGRSRRLVTLLDGAKPRFPMFSKMDICASNGLIHPSLLGAMR
jgi:hypothetical protein